MGTEFAMSYQFDILESLNIAVEARKAELVLAPDISPIFISFFKFSLQDTH